MKFLVKLSSAVPVVFAFLSGCSSPPPPVIWTFSSPASVSNAELETGTYEPVSYYPQVLISGTGVFGQQASITSVAWANPPSTFSEFTEAEKTEWFTDQIRDTTTVTATSSNTWQIGDFTEVGIWLFLLSTEGSGDDPVIHDKASAIILAEAPEV